MADHDEALRDYLIKGGTVGRRQTEITSRFNKVGADQLINTLEYWWTEDKVQKFRLPTPYRGGRRPIVWRATVKLEKEGV